MHNAGFLMHGARKSKVRIVKSVRALGLARLFSNNATQRKQPQQRFMASTQLLTTGLGNAPSTMGTKYNMV